MAERGLGISTGQGLQGIPPALAHLLPSAGRPSASPGSGRRDSPSPPGPCGEMQVISWAEGQVVQAHNWFSLFLALQPRASSLNLSPVFSSLKWGE